MRRGGVNELLEIALSLIFTASKGVRIMLEVWKTEFSRPDSDHGNDSALLEETLVVPSSAH